MFSLTIDRLIRSYADTVNQFTMTSVFNNVCKKSDKKPELNLTLIHISTFMNTYIVSIVCPRIGNAE